MIHCHLSAKKGAFDRIHNKCFSIIKFILTLESNMEGTDLHLTTLGFFTR